MIKPILTLGDPRLYEVSTPVLAEDWQNLPEWTRDLHDTLMEYRRVYGAGRAVAAPQIGIFKRLLYMYLWLSFYQPCADMPTAISYSTEYLEKRCIHSQRYRCPRE